MMNDYPQRLYHQTPPWVHDTAIFHIRIRCAQDNAIELTKPDIATLILESARAYVRDDKWSCYLMLLMPDHIHALLGFGRLDGMSETIRNWKRGQSRVLAIQWQNNYFDHRIRNAAEYSEKFAYIERNPVARGLCSSPQDWKWRISCFDSNSAPRL